ncbi:MAG TPA: hypothetical protein VK025_10090 [Steroidobacter sp.]|jgi:hypothetical protein|nr:hypothetical protein [Steroidobacteraceae bacterium]HLS81740.1 hypothetical protein [Steroidobacter sp.]
MDTPSLHIPEIASLLWAAVAFAALVASAYRRRRQRLPITESAGTPPGPSYITYDDAPTVRVADCERVGRRRKLVRLALDESVDIVEPHPRLPPRFRITLKRILEIEGGPAAHVVVEFGGAAVNCGAEVRELGFNEFLMPRYGRNEPRSSLSHFQENGDGLDFMRVKLRAADAAEGWAEFDVLQASSRWPTR